MNAVVMSAVPAEPEEVNVKVVPEVTVTEYTPFIEVPAVPRALPN
jgi:hypothetical protein